MTDRKRFSRKATRYRGDVIDGFVSSISLSIQEVSLVQGSLAPALAIASQKTTLVHRFCSLVGFFQPPVENSYFS